MAANLDAVPCRVRGVGCIGWVDCSGCAVRIVLMVVTDAALGEPILDRSCLESAASGFLM